MTSSDETGLMLGRVAATLPVQDIERAQGAFARVFGMDKVFENGDPVGFMILKRDAAELHLTLQPEHKAAAFNVAHMLVSNAEETCRRCKAEGFRILKGLDDKEYGLRAFVFADHDGNRIDVGQIL